MKLRIRDVVFEYESESVLEGVDLEVDRGETLGVIGPNGSGKSTLLRCINRILEPMEGRIFVDGEALHAASRQAIARTVGYVPQQETSTFPATVFDTVLMGRKPYISWRPTDEDRQRVADVIDALGLSELALRDVNELSGGQRQKVLIGRALAQDAEVLLLDEPTASLDVRHQLEVMDVVRTQVDRGITAVMAMHDLNLAARYCDEIAMLHEGRIFVAGPPEAVLTPENVRTVYDVEVSVLDHEGRLLVVPESPAEGAADSPTRIETR